MEMNTLELKLLRHEAVEHLAKLRGMRKMVVLSEAGKAFVNAEIAELSEQIESMDKALQDNKKARRAGRTPLRTHVKNFVKSILTREALKRKGVTR